MRRPILVGSIPVWSLDTLEKKIIHAAGHCDLVELRLDYLKELSNKIIEMLKPFAEKCILTVRSVDEGGINQFPEDLRAAFLSEAAEKGFMIDAELATCTLTGIRPFIASMHFFRKIPDEPALSDLVRKASESGKHVKIAYMPFPGARSSMVNLLEKNKNLSVMEMGGNPESRIAFSLLGSELIYCHLGDPTASGQMECSRAVKIVDCLWNNI
ncbi:MAG: type I 3-dehydroquinate dehydratase [Thermoplasmataceae archaeon]